MSDRSTPLVIVVAEDVVARSVPVAASQLARWATFGLHDIPHGQDARQPDCRS